METGKDYIRQTGIPFEKVAFEIRIHAQAYCTFPNWGYFSEHAAITDVSPYEGNIVQKIIDFLYLKGMR